MTVLTERKQEGEQKKDDEGLPGRNQPRIGPEESSQFLSSGKYAFAIPECVSQKEAPLNNSEFLSLPLPLTLSSNK